MTVRLTPAAEADLAEIVDFVALESSPDRAAAVLLAIQQAACRLAELPRIGHTRRDLTDEPVLAWRVFGFLVFYRPDTQPIEVVRIVHGSRDPRTILDALRDGPTA